MADLLIQPEPGEAFSEWRRLADRAGDGSVLGRDQSQWRDLTRRELGLDVSRPIIATGHQTLLWHPGILAKYIALDAAAAACDFARANLVVDQHVGEFGALEVPLRRSNGSLMISRIDLAAHVQADIPMALHPPLRPARPGKLSYALDSVASGVDRIVTAVNANRDAPNAAVQMCSALDALMRRWVRPTASVTASALCQTALGQAMIKRMIDDPQRCAASYNRAVLAVPEAGIGPLTIANDTVELPLWRIDSSQRRVGADSADIARLFREGGAAALPVMMPRALFMTALLRLGMCDVYIHGTGGATYDRAMEIWIRDWLGAGVAPSVVVSADLYLPLLDEKHGLDPEQAMHAARHAWHDPEITGDSAATPGQRKREMLERIARLPHNSIERRSAFLEMHRVLKQLRQAHQSRIDEAFERAEHARLDAIIASRRDWAFPLYPEASIDGLADAIRSRVRGGEVAIRSR